MRLLKLQLRLSSSNWLRICCAERELPSERLQELLAGRNQPTSGPPSLRCCFSAGTRRAEACLTGNFCAAKALGHIIKNRVRSTPCCSNAGKTTSPPYLRAAYARRSRYIELCLNVVERECVLVLSKRHKPIEAFGILVRQPMLSNGLMINRGAWHIRGSQVRLDHLRLHPAS